MISPLKLVVLLALLAAAPGSRPALAGQDDPLSTARAFMRAIYSNDKEAFERVVDPAPDSSRFLGTERLSFQQLSAVALEVAAMEFRQVQPFTLRGKEIGDEAGGYPEGTRTRYLTGYGGTPLVVTLVRRSDGWRVDLRWWLAMAAMAETEEEDLSSPEFAARSVLFGLIIGEKEPARAYLAGDGDLEIIFRGAPEPEPSDHAAALVVEMPMVRIPPGEFYALPDGTVAQGSRDPDRLVLVGLYGSIEIPFVLDRTSGEWLVQAHEYGRLLKAHETAAGPRFEVRQGYGRSARAAGGAVQPGSHGRAVEEIPPSTPRVIECIAVAREVARALGFRSDDANAADGVLIVRSGTGESVVLLAMRFIDRGNEILLASASRTTGLGAEQLPAVEGAFYGELGNRLGSRFAIRPVSDLGENLVLVGRYMSPERTVAPEK